MQVTKQAYLAEEVQVLAKSVLVKYPSMQEGQISIDLIVTDNVTGDTYKVILTPNELTSVVNLYNALAGVRDREKKKEEDNNLTQQEIEILSAMYTFDKVKLYKGVDLYECYDYILGYMSSGNTPLFTIADRIYHKKAVSRLLKLEYIVECDAPSNQKNSKYLWYKISAIGLELIEETLAVLHNPIL